MNAETQVIDILLLGSGGREHALAKKLSESPRCGKLYIAPGNGGTLNVGENVAIDEADPEVVADFVKGAGIGLVVIGPRPRWSRASPMPCARWACPALARVPLAPNLRAPSASPRSSWTAPASPPPLTAALITRRMRSPMFASRARRW